MNLVPRAPVFEPGRTCAALLSHTERLMRHLSVLCLLSLLCLSIGCGDDPKPAQTIIVIVEDEPDQASDQGAPDLAADLTDTPEMDVSEDMTGFDMSEDMSDDMIVDMPSDMLIDMEIDMTPDMAPDPCADFQNPALIRPNCGPAPLSVRFDGSGVLDGFEDIRDYYWELSDGSIETDLAFNAVYRDPGEYTEIFHFVVVVQGTRVEGSIDAKVRVLP